MPYQSFTDLLHELQAKARKSGAESEDLLAFLEKVEEELAGKYIEPKAIYRSLARAQAYSLRDGVDPGEQVSITVAALTLLQKADVMERRRV